MGRRIDDIDKGIWLVSFLIISVRMLLNELWYYAITFARKICFRFCFFSVWKKKENLSTCLKMQQTITTRTSFNQTSLYEYVFGIVYISANILSLGTRWRSISASNPSHFSAREKGSFNHWIEGFADPVSLWIPCHKILFFVIFLPLVYCSFRLYSKTGKIYLKFLWHVPSSFFLI
jgi:hypothetical protein